MHRSRFSCTPAVNIKMFGTAFFADLRPGRSTALGLQRERAGSGSSLQARNLVERFWKAAIHIRLAPLDLLVLGFKFLVPVVRFRPRHHFKFSQAKVLQGLER